MFRFSPLSPLQGDEMKPVRMLLAAMLLFAGKALAHGSLADLSVYDRTEGKQLQLYWHEGRAYMVGKPGNEYRITVRNRLREDLLAVVSVDGVNAITGQTADPRQSGYVLSPRGRLDIQGWRRNLGQTAAFYFTSLPDSYAARTGRPDHVGVIGVALFRKRQAPPPAPIGEARPLSRDRAAEAQIGTGHGRHETSHAYHVQFERASSTPAETIALYYDTRANLVARGVIRDGVPIAPYPQPFPAHPFPAFVPDPPGKAAG
jgi:hypothetical protein